MSPPARACLQVAGIIREQGSGTGAGTEGMKMGWDGMTTLRDAGGHKERFSHLRAGFERAARDAVQK